MRRLLLIAAEASPIVCEHFPMSVPKKFKGWALLLEMLIELCSSHMKIMDALNAKKIAMRQLCNAVTTDIEVTISTGKDVSLCQIIIAKIAMGPVYSRFTCAGPCPGRRETEERASLSTNPLH